MIKGLLISKFIPLLFFFFKSDLKHFHITGNVLKLIFINSVYTFLLLSAATRYFWSGEYIRSCTAPVNWISFTRSSPPSWNICSTVQYLQYNMHSIIYSTVQYVQYYMQSTIFRTLQYNICIAWRNIAFDDTWLELKWWWDEDDDNNNNSTMWNAMQHAVQYNMHCSTIKNTRKSQHNHFPVKYKFLLTISHCFSSVIFSFLISWLPPSTLTWTL